MSYQPTQCQAHREPRGHLLNVHPAPLLSSSHPLYLYSSASTATTKHHHPETHCLRALGAGSPGSGCQQGWFLVSSLSLACKCLPSCSVLTWPFLCANTPLVFLPLLIRSPVLSYSNPTIMISEFPGGSVFKKKKKNCLQFRSHRRHKFDPWVRKISWRRAQQPTPVFLPRESRGLRSLVGYNP